MIADGVEANVLIEISFGFLLDVVSMVIYLSECFLAHLAMPKMSLYDDHLSLVLSVLLVLSASVDSILKDEFYMSSLKFSLIISTISLILLGSNVLLSRITI